MQRNLEIIQSLPFEDMAGDDDELDGNQLEDIKNSLKQCDDFTSEANEKPGTKVPTFDSFTTPQKIGRRSHKKKETSI